MSTTYVQILRSSAIMGGSSLLNLCVGLIRTKAMALMLGPPGIGLLGAYAAIGDLARSLAEVGINQSGVRQIAEADSSGDAVRMARTATVLRRTALVLGCLGAGVLALCAAPVARLTFGDEDCASSVALLSVGVLLGLVCSGQAALLQGLRRIGDLAKMSVLGTALGTLVALPIVFFLREEGVVPALVAGAAVAALLAGWYARKVAVPTVAMTWRDTRTEVRNLLRLGIAFLISAVAMMGAAYAVRIVVLRSAGLEGAGYYQTAWTMGGLYVGFVLQAMGTDFYPRLVGQIADHAASNRLVNEQARISMLLAGPGVIATLVLAPTLVTLLYSDRFQGAIEVLRWICIGMAMRVITWPMGFLIVAKNRQRIFVAVELAWAAANIALSAVLVQSHGLTGAGIAFFTSYVFHGLLIYPIVRRMTGFRWHRANVETAGQLMLLTGAAFIGFHVLPPTAAYVLGFGAMGAASWHSLSTLRGLVGVDTLPASVLRLLALLKVART